MNKQTSNLEKILPSISGQVCGKREFEQALTQRLTIRLWSGWLIEKDSWEGFFTDGARKWLKIDSAADRLTSLLKSSLESAEESQLSFLTNAQKKNYYSLRFSYSPPQVQCQALQTVEAILAAAESQAVGNVAETAEQVNERQRISLLRNAGTGLRITPKQLQIICSDNASNLSADELSAILPILQSARGISPYFNATTLREALRKRKAFEELISFGKNPLSPPSAKWQRLSQLSADTAREVSELKSGEKILLMGQTRGRTPDLEWLKKTHPMAKDLLSLLDRDQGESLSARLAEQIGAYFQKLDLLPPDAQQSLRQIVAKGVVGYFAPELEKSLTENRSLGAKICLAPFEWFRKGFVGDLNQNLDQLTSGMKQALSSLLSEQDVRELHQAFLSQNLKRTIQNKVQQHVRRALQLSEERLESSMMQISSLFPPYCSALFKKLGYGDLGEIPNPFWLELKREEDDTLSLYVFTCGSAVYLDSAIEAGGKLAYQTAAVYRQLTEKELGAEFFQTFFSYETSPAWGERRSSTIVDLREGLLGSLGRKPEPSGDNPAMYSVFGANRSGHWGAMLSYLQLQHNGPCGHAAETKFLFDIRLEAVLKPNFLV